IANRLQCLRRLHPRVRNLPRQCRLCWRVVNKSTESTGLVRATTIPNVLQQVVQRNFAHLTPNLLLPARSATIFLIPVSFVADVLCNNVSGSENEGIANRV